MDQRLFLCGLCRLGFLPVQDGFSVCFDPYHIGMGVPDPHHGFAVCGLYLGLNEDPAGDPAHFHMDPSGLHQGLCRRIVLFCHIGQALQLLFRSPGHGSQGSRIFVSEKQAVGDPAGVGIFIHAAV